ncbi:MAG TPA: hypothetical protein DEQ51_02205 [Alphaproteobacteria bacterium]|nr:hypothetical protein [Alphaproteobacteria bacterium]|tara:strand:- start:265 stop:465 length:201 start_codon:yes stop_codon:yes gene_type:complete
MWIEINPLTRSVFLAARIWSKGRRFCAGPAEILSCPPHLISYGFLWDIMGIHGGQWELTVKYGKMV